MINTNKNIKSLEERKQESLRILHKHKIKIPIIVLIDKKIKNHKPYYKFLVSSDITMSNLQSIIRSRIKLKPSDTIFCLTESNSLLQGSIAIYDVYKMHKDKDDNMLYIFTAMENTFGS